MKTKEHHIIGSGTVARLWGTVMNDVHSGLPSKDYEKPSGIETASICKESGLLATDLCKAGHGTGNQVYTEYFVTGTKPNEFCDVHVQARVCNVTGKLASENCKDTSDKIFITRDGSEKSWQSAADAKYMLPGETCSQCQGGSSPEVQDPNGKGGNTTIDTNTTQDPNTNTNTNTTTNPNTNTTKDPNTNTNTNETQKPNTNETQKPNTNTETNTNN